MPSYRSGEPGRTSEAVLQERKEGQESKEQAVNAFLEAEILRSTQPDELRKIAERVLDRAKDFQGRFEEQPGDKMTDEALTVDEICAFVQKEVQVRLEKKDFADKSNLFPYLDTQKSLRDRVVESILRNIFHGLGELRTALLAGQDLQMEVYNEEDDLNSRCRDFVVFESKIENGKVLCGKVLGGYRVYTESSTRPPYEFYEDVRPIEREDVEKFSSRLRLEQGKQIPGLVLFNPENSLVGKISPKPKN